jgi:hypothetical protein
MTSTSKRVSARTAARQRQARANEDQRRRQEEELEHATEFEVARLRRDEALATVTAHETDMANRVSALAALGNPLMRVAELTGETEVEIKRLRKLADGSTNSADRSPADAAGTQHRRPVSPEARGRVSAMAEHSGQPSDSAGSTPDGAAPTSDRMQGDDR